MGSPESAAAPATPAGTTALTADGGSAADPSPAGVAPPAAPNQVTAGAVPPASPVTPAATVPLELKLPDGFSVDEPLLGRFKTLAQESGLKSESAQKLFDLYAETQNATAARQQAEAEKRFSAWTEALKADTEFGGEKFDANAQVARKAMVKFGTPELRAFLEQTGLGNHPELVRFVYRIGKSLAEDSVAGSASNGQPNAATTEEARHRAIYDHPTSQKMFKE